MNSAEIEQQIKILHVAHEWRHKMAQPNPSKNDQIAFEAWLASDPRHVELYDRAITFFQAMGKLEAEDLGDEVMRKTFQERWSLILRTLKSPKLPQVGAVVAAAFAVAIVTWVNLPSAEVSATPPNLSREIARYETEIGEKQDIVLSDGTVVTLGAATAVEVAFSKSTRSATLVSGSALFEVESETDRPFTVESGDLEARVLGTVFEVKNSGDLIRVAVAEGSVEISYPFITNEGKTSLRSRRELSGGEQITALSRHGLQSVEPVRPSAVGSWREGKIYYNGAYLSELVSDANRYSGERVVLVGDIEKLSNYLVQGSFNIDDIDGMLSVLSDIYPVTIDRSAADTIRIVYTDRSGQ